MQSVYSIELNAEKINNSKSREYFTEVTRSYAAGNYRSALVMLWSVIVCDLFFKLKDLVEIYEDEIAKEILDEIDDLRASNQYSSGWEMKLVESVTKRTNLLDNTERDYLDQLRIIRNKSSHPIIDSNYELHQPTRDMVRAHIRQSLEAVLNKPPFFSKNIIDSLLLDLEDISQYGLDDDKLQKYLDSKYFSKLTPIVKERVFRSLWKLVFRVKGDKEEKNRKVNFQAIRFLYELDPTVFCSQITKEPGYYSDIANEGKPAEFLVRFLAYKREVYDRLEHHAKIIVGNISKNHDSSAFFLSWFLAENIESHFKKLTEAVTENPIPTDLDEDTWKELIFISKQEGWDNSLITRLGYTYYGNSNSFDIANTRFSIFIEPLLKEYTLNDCLELMEEIKNNNQTSRRNRAKSDHEKIMTKVREFNSEFDFSNFKLFEI